MKNIIEFFVKRTLLVNILLFAILALSVYALFSTKRNAMPEVDLATVLITTQYPGASPKDVEQNVTRLIEDELKGLSGIEKFTSISDENVSTIIVNVDLDYPDQKQVIDDIRRAVDRVSELPKEVPERPSVIHLKSSELPVLVIGVSGDKTVDYAEIRRTAKIIERDLRNIKGVSKIDKIAYRHRTFQIDINPNKLKEYYVSLNDVLFALENRNIRSTGGNLETFRTQRNILTMSEFENLDHVKNVIIRSTFGGGDLKIKDVAHVKDGFSKEMMRSMFNNKKGISLIIKKSSNADIIDVVDALQNYTKEKQKIVPKGITLTAVNDESLEVRNRISVVSTNAIMGFFLVILVLVVFLNFRASFWIAMSIPTALGIALILIPYFGMDLNTITLAAMIIVLGMLVDDSIVVSENIMRHRVMGKSSFKATIDGTCEVLTPVMATIITTVLAFVPMFAMTGVLGRFVQVVPTVIIAALIGSMLECFLILPNHICHSSADFTASEKGWRGRFFQKCATPYRRWLTKALKMRYPVVIGVVVLLAFTLWWGAKKVGLNLFPTDGAQTFYVYIELEESQTFDATEEVVNNIQKHIASLPKDILNYFTSQIGTDSSDPLVKPIGGQENLAYIKVMLTPYSTRDIDIEKVITNLRDKTTPYLKDKNVLSIRYEVEKPGPPAGTPIEFHIHSDNDKHREIFVKKIIYELQNMDGVNDINSSSKKGREEYKLNIDYDKLAATNLTVNDVASTLRIAFDGIQSTSIVKNNEEISIRVQFPLKYRQDINNVLELMIRNQENKLIPIKTFAQISKIQAESSIHHTDGDVTTTINGQTDGVTVMPKTVVEHLTKKFSPELIDYPDVSFSYGGEAEKTDESMKSLKIAFIGGIIAIYLVIALLFNSLSQPVLILLAIPFGLIGVIWAFYFHGRPFSFLGLVGVVGLSGVVVNNSLIMVDFINGLVRKEFNQQKKNTALLIQKIVDGAGQRLRPVIITTITTVMGLLPTAYGIGGSDPFIEPMVLAIAYGLLFATFLTLFLIPCFYLINEDMIKGLKKIIPKRS